MSACRVVHLRRGLVLTVAAILIGLVVLFKGFGLLNRHLDERIARARTGRGVAGAACSRITRGRSSRSSPEEDLRWMRDAQRRRPGRYGWVDRSAGVVRLPVDRAMDLLAERGLPPVSPGQTLEELQRERAQPAGVRPEPPAMNSLASILLAGIAGGAVFPARAADETGDTRPPPPRGSRRRRGSTRTSARTVPLDARVPRRDRPADAARRVLLGAASGDPRARLPRMPDALLAGARRAGGIADRTAR